MHDPIVKPRNIVFIILYFVVAILISIYKLNFQLKANKIQLFIFIKLQNCTLEVNITLIHVWLQSNTNQYYSTTYLHNSDLVTTNIDHVNDSMKEKSMVKHMWH